MTEVFGPADRILHTALDRRPGKRLDDARLSDRQRLGILLQGTALLAHLEHGGWRLVQGWDGARVSADGVFRAGEAVPGPLPELPQVLLSRLAFRLFSSEQTIAGRGEARRAARSVLTYWHQGLSPVSLDDAVGQVIEAAPFLWQQDFDLARGALVAEHLRGAKAHAWIAGPGVCRRRLLALGEGREDLERLVTSRLGRRFWEGTSDRDPRALVAAGRPAAAVAVWEEKPPTSAQRKLEYAQALFSTGKFKKAVATLRGHYQHEARVLRTWSQYLLGELGAAKATLKRLESVSLSPSVTVDAADVAVRVLANAGETRTLLDWVARALAASHGTLRIRARLIAASAMWDLGDEARMKAYLPDEAQATQTGDLAWRYYQVRGLQAMAAADGPAIVDFLSKALARGRRHLKQFEAGRLWNDLAVGRAQANDLAGAERACLHSVRLLGACDGPLRTTLALYNLAEVRIRRGRLQGVEEILCNSSQQNRQSNNVRGGSQDAELWARFELARGNPRAALTRCEAALDRLEAEGMDWHQAELRVFAARALGWLGRGREAAEMLAGSTDRARAQLDPEERPALWALAHRLEAAGTDAQESGFPELWQRVLGGQAALDSHWRRLHALEPYRQARLVFDCEQVRNGSTPMAWRRQAIEILRRQGSALLAERLEASLSGPWLALENYLLKPPGDPDALTDLFAAAGYGEGYLSWESDHGVTVLVNGAGGGEEISAPLGGGRLVLRSPHLDELSRVLFSIAQRDVVPVHQVSQQAPRGGMVGESKTLHETLARIAKLAPEEVPILVLGETGTGKELAVREIHRASRHSAAPFLVLNCAAVATENLLLSDLFGHARGAFTGADRDRQGVFEAARGGTVFLDEIGDLPPSAQGMLLRVLQEGEVRRLGESQARRVNVRVVAATNRDLGPMVAQGTFRQDLYYRLKVATVRLPRLRDRGADVLLLAEHFLARRRAPDQGRNDSKKGPVQLSPEARTRLLAYDWPGNVRELENMLEAAMALCAGTDGGTIHPEHLELPETGQRPVSGYHEQVRAFRRRLVEEALDTADGRQAEAARRLGLTRQALSYLVRQLGLA